MAIKTRTIVAFLATAVMILGCTVGPKDSEGNPIPTGPNPSIEPDHPPIEPTDLPKTVHIINIIVTATRGPIEITGTIAGERFNGPPSQPIAARIGSGGGTWKGYVPYGPKTKVAVFIQAKYNGPSEYLEAVRLTCELNEAGVAPQIHHSLVGANIVNCLWDAKY